MPLLSIMCFLSLNAYLYCSDCSISGFKVYFNRTQLGKLIHLIEHIKLLNIKLSVFEHFVF